MKRYCKYFLCGESVDSAVIWLLSLREKLQKDGKSGYFLITIEDFKDSE